MLNLNFVCILKDGSEGGPERPEHVKCCKEQINVVYGGYDIKFCLCMLKTQQGRKT
jgi:hypothetical protein